MCHSGEDEKAFALHAELGHLYLPDVVAVDLEGKRPIIERGDAQVLEPRERMHLPVTDEVRPLGECAPEQGRDVDRAGPSEHDP